MRPLVARPFGVAIRARGQNRGTSMSVARTPPIVKGLSGPKNGPFPADLVTLSTGRLGSNSSDATGLRFCVETGSRSA
jgi:hypothetical protein